MVTVVSFPPEVHDRQPVHHLSLYKLPWCYWFRIDA